MTAFAVTYTLRNDIRHLPPSEAEALEPKVKRVVASDAQRAISSLVNELKRDAIVGSKADVRIEEVKVIP